MKFGKRYRKEMLSEWEVFYISYKQLKKAVNAAAADLSNPSLISAVLSTLEEEIRKPEAHFVELLNELLLTKETLLTQAKAVLRRSSFYMQPSFGQSPPERSELQSLVDRPEGSSPKAEAFRWMLLQSQRRNQNRATGRSAADTTKQDFFVWVSTARQLVRFAELNVEAVFKAQKKFRKLLGWHGEKLAGQADRIVEASVLTSGMDELCESMEEVCHVFQDQFGHPLEQFRDISMSTEEEWTARWWRIAAAFVVFIAVLIVPIPQFAQAPQAKRCLAMFTFVMIMWLSQAIPFFCTALIIPLIVVPLGVLDDPGTGKPAAPSVAAKMLLGSVFDYKQFLVLGGLTLAKGLAKTQLELYAMRHIHRHTAHKPALYLLYIMVSGCLLSAFVGNYAAAILTLSVMQPTLWEMPRSSGAQQAMLLGLAIACNIGGMLSPIASPQNTVAVQLAALSQVTFIEWFVSTLPLAVVCVVGGWAFLMAWYRPFDHIAFIPQQLLWYKMQSSNRGLTKDRIVVLVVVTVTILLWCLPPSLFFGDIGTVSLIPIVVFFGIGILKREDFQTLPWHLVFLIGGGNMLAVCAVRSGLLETVAAIILPHVSHLSPYHFLLVIALLMLAASSLLKHVVAALVFLPFIAEAGQRLASHDILSAGKTGLSFAGFLQHGTAVLSEWEQNIWTVTLGSLLLSCTLMCSGSMILPISSFPNIQSLLAEDDTGKRYLKTNDFYIPMLLMTAIVYFSLVTFMVPYLEWVQLAFNS